MRQKIQWIIGLMWVLSWGGLAEVVIAQERYYSDEDRLRQIKYALDDLAIEVPGLEETANFSVVAAPLQELLRGISETHRLNISVDPAISAQVTNNFHDVLVKDLLYFLCKEYQLDVRFVNNIMSFYPYQRPKAPALPYEEKELSIEYDNQNDLLSVNLNRDSLTIFTRQLTEKSGKNIILASEVRDNVVSAYLRNAPFDQGLEKVAFANNLTTRKTEDGFYIIEPKSGSSEATTTTSVVRRSANHRRNHQGNGTSSEGTSSSFFELKLLVSETGDSLLSIEALEVPIVEVIEAASRRLNKDYVFFTVPEGVATCFLKEVSYENLLSFLLQNTQHTYRQQESVYLIGQRNQEGLRSSELIRMQFRTVEEVEEIIPVELRQGVEIKVFKDLNSIIVSGGRPQINEVKAFLRGIDQLVPNILIEVIVVDVKKGSSLQTGIQAGLSDSTVTTGGQILSGVDMTLSSRSINSVLSKLSNNGIVNLGQVTPQFYVNLQALENENMINVRSTPKLSTLNGHEAALSIGQTQFFAEQTQNITTGVSPINTVTQRFRELEANLEIKINPFVAGDEHVTLNIEASFSDFIEPTGEGLPPGNATRSFISKIRVRDQEMIVLGGLEEVRRSNSGSGTPGLSRVPVLKWLFSSRSKSRAKNQLIIFIKPTIVY
ncbi:type II secretion system protein GspD [Tunicatimonas pelagia]|uniref:type II secretion system protein GspD n=1 Tax=Tunicatimonas pelagia TaxID=931531 RepID=UPI002664FC9C|nr:type II and III secretion system protein [Tunicatimonas pelagia]WKN45345.1 type II and III secretion system protein [Tunicatimonas pelagia]